MIKGDVLFLKSGSDVIKDLFFVPSHPLKSSLCSLISVLSSTVQGIGYLSRNVEDMTAIEKIVDVLKDQDDGSVTQRFCLAALQKISFLSFKNGASRILESLVNKGLIDWI